MPCDRPRFRLVDYPAPQQVAVVGSQRIYLAAVVVEGYREVLAVLDPEVAVEAPLEIRGLLLQMLGERRVLPDLAGEAGTAHLGVVGIPLKLAGRAREPRQITVPV